MPPSLKDFGLSQWVSERIKNKTTSYMSDSDSDKELGSMRRGALIQHPYNSVLENEITVQIKDSNQSENRR